MTRDFFAPAEDAPHAGTWMAWPSTAAIYGGGSYYQSVQETLGRLARAIAEHEPVWMAAGAEHHALAAQLCGPEVRMVDIDTDDMWARDSGPVFLIGCTRGTALADFNFNGWGGKQHHDHDARLAGRIAKYLGCERRAAPVRGEGGGLEYDGEGTLILTESCWVNDNRNPGLSRAGIEAALKAQLGVEVVIWIPGVRGRDITDGHIDGSIRIVRPGLLLANADPDRHSEWALAQKDALTILRAARDARGRSFEIVEVASAVEVRSSRADFFSSYANYYVGNGAVYTPQFGDRVADARAQQTLARLFPDRKVVALDMDRIYENGGGIHCVTQQQPAAKT
ncbi:MAG: agmatine deiminase family protein [Steroidobacteraceae bacterium]